MIFQYHSNSYDFISGAVLHRTFMLLPSKRHNVHNLQIDRIRTIGECSVHCIQRSDVCVGFNFHRGPPTICELCRVPHDAPNANMVIAPTWDHYAIVPWGINISLIDIVEWYFLKTVSVGEGLTTGSPRRKGAKGNGLKSCRLVGPKFCTDLFHDNPRLR